MNLNFQAGTAIPVYINRSFDCPVVGGSFMKRTCIGISENGMIFFRYKVGIFLQGMFYSLREFIQ